MTAQQLSDAFQRGLAFALEVHGEDVRKGEPPVPYVSHLLGVASLVIEDGGTESEAIAGLLHDCAEDHGGAPMLHRIDDAFGPDVRTIVEACSDSLLEKGAAKEEWRPRKERYLAALASPGHAVALRVSNADKLHNARAILADYRRLGDELWNRFNTGSGEDQLWYYKSLARLFMSKRQSSPLARELEAAVGGLESLMQAPGSSNRDAWLEGAIVDTREYADSMLEGFEAERMFESFASEDYDWLLLERHFGESATETLKALKRERDLCRDYLRGHREKWGSGEP